MKKLHQKFISQFTCERRVGGSKEAKIIKNKNAKKGELFDIDNNDDNNNNMCIRFLDT